LQSEADDAGPAIQSPPSTRRTQLQRRHCRPHKCLRFQHRATVAGPPSPGTSDRKKATTARRHRRRTLGLPACWCHYHGPVAVLDLLPQPGALPACYFSVQTKRKFNALHGYCYLLMFRGIASSSNVYCLGTGGLDLIFVGSFHIIYIYIRIIYYKLFKIIYIKMIHYKLFSIILLISKIFKSYINCQLSYHLSNIKSPLS
jgi:hypothetical protein